MKFAIPLTMKRVVLGSLCSAMLAAVGCADGDGRPTGPSATPAVPGLTATAASDDAQLASKASPRSGDLHVTKECSEYFGHAGEFCTITASNLKQIEVGSKVVYVSAAGATSLDSDVVLDPPGPGNNRAFGHCHLEFAEGVGLCTFSGGTGKFKWFLARADVSHVGGVNWAWDGTYSFSPHD